MTKHFYKIFVFILLAISLASCSSSTYVLNNSTNNTKGYIVVLHGIVVGNWQMYNLAQYLADNNYEVINVSYPSTSYDLAELKNIVTKDIKNHIKTNKPVHFVGFSMGGLVLRAVLKDYRPKQMGRVVHIATPNQGSEVADIMQNCPVYKFIFGPAGQQLITNQSKFNALFGKINYEIGIISGYEGFGFPFSDEFEGPNDGKVSVASTLVTNAKDHIKISGTHSLLPFQEQVQYQTLKFINTGKFDKNL